MASPAPDLNPPFSRLGTPSQQFQGGSRHPSPELKGSLDNAPASARVKNASEISLGSPVSKSANKRDQLSDELTPTADSKGNRSKSGEAGDRKAAPASARGKPLKLDLPLNPVQPPEASPSKAEPFVPTSASQGPAPASATGSRPNTPLTNASRVSDSSAPRQPRVLRVVDASKNETPPPSATQSISSIPQAGKARARKPSLSSLSRPETPGDLGSEGAEGDVYASASASRANSPPASSRIGSAPVRSMTKSQAKKDRKQKAKEADAKKLETSAPVEEPVQAPIVGRKRKTKKTPASTAEPPSATPEPVAETNQPPKESDEAAHKPEQKEDGAKKTKQEKPKKEAKATPVEEKAHADEKTSAEAWRSKNTLEQMLKDSESSGVSTKELFSERTRPLQTLLSQLHKSGALDLNNHPLFNPSNLSQRFDMKCLSDDYEVLKHPIELTDEHRKTLLRGEPVRINGDSTQLKDRCLISPRGCILHHLSREEEDRYLALEKSVSWALDAFQEYPGVPITEPDITNRGGGLDALFATPENFNICWVDEASAGLGYGSATGPLSAPESSVSSLPSAPLNVLSAMEDDSTRSHNWAITNTAELVNATAASVRSFAAATAKHMLGAAGVVMSNIPDLDDVVGMTDEELRSFSVKSQKELEGSRKELDSIDKKLAGLLKRNKKLAQQAVATNVD